MQPVVPRFDVSNDQSDGFETASFLADQIVEKYDAAELRQIVTAAHKRYRDLTGKGLLPPVVPKVFTVSQVGELLGLTASGVRQHCAKGTISAIKVGPRCWLIPEWSVERFVQDRGDEHWAVSPDVES
jgi:excisionase family DNA binding protein